MKHIIRGILRKVGFDIVRHTCNPVERFFSLRPKQTSRGNVLLALWIEPFLLKKGEAIPNNHTHSRESFEIARIFSDLGYSVDIIDHRNRTFVPEKDYALFISFRTNFETIVKRLNKDCIKIVHLDTAHWLFNNSASFRRGLCLQQRKGVALKALRVVESNMAIEFADYATILGNHFTCGTYSYAKKPMYPVPISTCAVYPWQDDKDFESCRKNFLWFGSSGTVHKGLDLALEAFAEMPDYQLTVCGSIQGDTDFLRVYNKELYDTPNIHMMGRVDLESDFPDIARSCVGLLYPSCSEGQSGSTVLCMHAGLIPIISYETGVTVDGFGIILNDCSIDTIRETVKRISGLPPEELRAMSRRAWEYARTHHTKENFAKEYRNVIEQILSLKYHQRLNNKQGKGDTL
jgi:glycosyltransferase involved in cell wall biosynthesis